MDEGYHYGRETDRAAAARGGRDHATRAQPSAHLVGGSLSLVRHRRASARDRAAQQSAKYGSSHGYGYGQYGFGQQAPAPSIWGHQSARAGWNRGGGAAKQPARPGSAVRAASASGTRSKHAAPSRSRGRY